MTISSQKFVVIFLAIALLIAGGFAFSKSSVASSQSPVTLLTAKDDVTADHEKLSASVQKAWQSSVPIKDMADLESRLKLSKRRLQSINIGGPINTIGTSSSRMGFFCSGAKCICIGDSDCNDLFSGVCNDPRTGGSCRVTGRVVVCTCNPRSAS
jgi:hypothetical protein